MATRRGGKPRCVGCPTTTPSRASDGLRQRVDGLVAGGDKAVSQQQILGRIAADDQLGDHQQIGACLQGPLGRLLHQQGIPADISDGGIKLCQCNFHVTRVFGDRAYSLQPTVSSLSPFQYVL